MAIEPSSHRAGEAPSSAAGSRARGLAAMLALVFAYIGLLAGNPAPGLSVRPDQAALRAVQGIHHLAAREGTRAAALSERTDPGSPPPPPPNAPVPARAELPAPSGLPAAGLWPRAKPIRTARPSPAHQPRAPPFVPA